MQKSGRGLHTYQMVLHSLELHWYQPGSPWISEKENSVQLKTKIANWKLTSNRNFVCFKLKNFKDWEKFTIWSFKTISFFWNYILCISIDSPFFGKSKKYPKSSNSINVLILNVSFLYFPYLPHVNQSRKFRRTLSIPANLPTFHFYHWDEKFMTLSFMREIGRRGRKWRRHFKNHFDHEVRGR